MDAVRPADQERGADAARIGMRLVALERRVAGHGPAKRVVVVGKGTAHVVQPREILLDTAAEAIARPLVIVGAVGTALRTCAVVGNGEHDGVVALAERVDLVEEPLYWTSAWSRNPAKTSSNLAARCFSSGLVLRQAQIDGYLRHYHGTNVSGERQRPGTLVAWSTSGAGPRAKPKAPAVGHFLVPDSFCEGCPLALPR